MEKGCEHGHVRVCACETEREEEREKGLPKRNSKKPSPCERQ